MQFAMPSVTNATAEIAAADRYPHVRLFTVGQGTANRPGQPPLRDLKTVQQPWVVASSGSVAGGGEFGVFSAVCWLFGKAVFDGLAAEGPVPIGLVSNNVGGTRIEKWLPPNSLASCETAGGPHVRKRRWACSPRMPDFHGAARFTSLGHPILDGAGVGAAVHHTHTHGLTAVHLNRLKPELSTGLARCCRRLPRTRRWCRASCGAP